MNAKLTLIGTMAVACATIQLAAMPTEEETKRAEPVVQRMLAPEKAALDAGKKTRSEVAAAAMKLADKAEIDATRLLLMKGAFILYVQDGNLEKAVETLNSLKAAIPDIPPQSVTNIIETALPGASKEGERARLYKLLGEAKAESTTEKTRKDIAKLFPGWSLDSEVPQENRKEWASGFCATHRGQDSVLRLHPVNRKTPIVLSRTLTLSKENPCLFLKTASFDKDSDFLLSVLVNGKEVLPKRLIRTPDSEPWQDITVPLSAWRGNKVKIEVVLTANDWWLEHPFFKRLEVAEGTGQEKLVSEAKAIQNTADVELKYGVVDGGVVLVSRKGFAFRSRPGLTLGDVKSKALKITSEGAVVIPDTIDGLPVREIGDWAFHDCPELKSVTIPSCVTNIGKDAFNDCGARSTFCVASGNSFYKSVSGHLLTKDGKTLVWGVNVNGNLSIPDGVKRIAYNAFRDCAGITGVTIPDSVTSIGSWAFFNCSGLKSVTIPDNVTRIEWGAFCRCSGLVNVTVGNGVTYIGPIAFDCIELTAVTMRGERPNAPNDIFKNCGKLKAIHVSANAKSWAGMKDWLGIPLVFDKTEQGLETDRKRQAEAEAVAKQEEEKKAREEERVKARRELAAVVEELRKAREERKEALRLEAKSIGQEKVVSEATKTHGGYTWSYRVKNGEATLVAEKDGKYSCALSPTPTGNVTIPPTLNYIKVTSIGEEAFGNCKELTSVTIPAGVTHIDVHAFAYCDRLESVTLPSSLKVIGYAAFGKCSGLRSVTIPNGVKSIWADAFNGCGLKSVVIPSSVTSIGDRAFCECGELESVAIPAEVVKLGKGVFAGCNALKRINVDSGNQVYASIDGVLYTKDRSVLAMWPNPPESAVIPAGVTSIGDVAFLNCIGLKSMTIPSSVKNIGEHAFERCGELASVTMRGERPELEKDNIFDGCGKLKSIHVPANAKSWAGMKEWLGIPLVFDAELKNR